MDALGPGFWMPSDTCPRSVHHMQGKICMLIGPVSVNDFLSPHPSGIFG